VHGEEQDPCKSFYDAKIRVTLCNDILSCTDVSNICRVGVGVRVRVIIRVRGRVEAESVSDNL